MVEFQRSSLKSCISSPRVLLSTVFPLTSKDFGHYYFGFSSFRDFAWSRALRGLSLFGLEGITSCLELQDLKVFAPSKAYVSRTLSWLHPAAESGNLLPALNPSPPLYLRGKKHPKFSLAPLPKLTTTSIGVLSMTWTSYNATRFRLVLHPLCFAQIWDWFNKVQQCLKWASTKLCSCLILTHEVSCSSRHGLHMLRVFMKWMKLDSSQRSLVQTIVQLVELRSAQDPCVLANPNDGGHVHDKVQWRLPINAA